MILEPAPTPLTSTDIQHDDLAGLPSPVRRYLEFSGVVGKPRVETVRLSYGGRFRMGKGQMWMPLQAEQCYTTDPPGFMWKAKFMLVGVPFMSAVDVYKNGHSHMTGRFAGLFKVVDGHGEAVDQGGMVRFLQEMTWFPSTYLNDYITWDAVDDHCADVSFHDAGKTVSARMYFDDEGRFLNFVAEHYGDFDGKYEMRPWSTPMSEYSRFDGYMLPVRGKGVWRLPEGDFAYIDVSVTDIRYNVPIEDF